MSGDMNNKKVALNLTDALKGDQNPKEVRVWCDGCYDLVHFGHANSIRQAKLLGDKVIVGVHSDLEILQHKGPTVFNENERVKMVKAIKWVDEVVLGAPYITTLDCIDKHMCDFCVHGNDITMTSDGKDTYKAVKEAGRYREISRTAGISTTDLVKRMLANSHKFQEYHVLPTESGKQTEEQNSDDSKPTGSLRHAAIARDPIESPWTGSSPFLLSTQKIIEFCDGKAPKPGDKVVYIDGAFDLFHVGHLDFLEKVKDYGDFLIVGLHADDVVNWYKGGHYPIMTLHERLLNLLSCRYVNEVIIGAPYDVTNDLLDHFKIDLVCHGNTPKKLNNKCDPYAIPKSRAIYKEVDSGNSLTTDDVVKRILKNRIQFEDRNYKKEVKEVLAHKELFKDSNGPNEKDA